MIEENNDTIVKNDEKCKEKLQELATKDIQYDQELENIRLNLESSNRTGFTMDEGHKDNIEKLENKTNLHANKLQELTSKDSQYDQEIEKIKLNGVAKCPLSEPNTFIIEGGCYTFVDQNKTSTNAKIYCESKQARLFEPRSVNTNKLVYEKSKDILRGQRNWLGVITKNGISENRNMQIAVTM